MGSRVRKTVSSVGLCQVLAPLLLWWSAVVMQHSGVNGQGWWEVVVNNAGIATMHAAVTRFGNVVLLDRTNIGDSQLPLPNGVCRNNPQDRVSFGQSSHPDFPPISSPPTPIEIFKSMMIRLLCIGFLHFNYRIG